MHPLDEGTLYTGKPTHLTTLPILLIEDDGEIASTLSEYLEREGYEVCHCRDGESGLRAALSAQYSALIVDRMIPGIDGLTLVRRLRGAGHDTPVVMLTALGRLQDRLDGLDAGADDYLVKPFALSEMLARLKAVTRRRVLGDAPTLLVAGSVTLNIVTRKVSRSGQEVVLQPREFRLLEELVRHAGTFVPRVVLLERVWNMRFDPRTKIIETHMSRIRTKLNAHGPNVIETLRGLGYRIAVD